MTITLISSEFDLFEERESIDESVFRDHKFNKVISSYSIYPSDRKKFALSYSHFFNNKIGFVFETALSESGDSYAEKSDFMLGLTYRFTRRARTWVFSGDLGLSANDDVKDYEGISKGFRLNHLTGKFISEYIFPGGFGLAYTMTGRMPLEFDLDEDVSPIHAVALTFQF
jgi:hypothetical protein